MPSYPVTPSGFCQCGCGARTALCHRTRPEYGHVAGEYYKFVKGHNSKVPPYVIDQKTGCWNWQRKATRAGYGQTWANGKTRLAHRVFWERANGPIPEGHEVHHTCNNPSCVNPNHLLVLTPSAHAKLKTRKLDDDAVSAIRNSPDGVCETARKFGVHPSHVSKIRNGQRRAA